MDGVCLATDLSCQPVHLLFTFNWTWLVVEYLMRHGVGYIL